MADRRVFWQINVSDYWEVYLSAHTRPCGAQLFGSISAAVPGLLLVKHVSSVGMDLLASTHGGSDLDFTPEAAETEIFIFCHVFLLFQKSPD